MLNDDSSANGVLSRGYWMRFSNRLVSSLSTA